MREMRAAPAAKTKVKRSGATVASKEARRPAGTTQSTVATIGVWEQETATEAKAAFEAAFGHQGDDHNPGSVPNALRRRLYSRSDCGWWWCGADLDPSLWKRLLRAAKILKKKNLDPKGLDILALVSGQYAAEQLAPARDALNEFDAAARKLRSVLWPNGATEVGPKKWEVVGFGEQSVPIEVKDDPYTLLTATIRRFEPLVAVANAARPAGQDPRVTHGPRWTLAKARELSYAGDRERALVPKRWTNEAVVAARILTGVDKTMFDSQVARLGKMRTRQPKTRR